MVNRIINNKVLSILILLTIHFLFRAILLANDVFPFNSDEAVVGLMAKHILAGENFLYFYGQSYMGSVDAYLISLGFALFGVHIVVIRIVQIFLYALTILFFYLYIDLIFQDRKISFFSALFLVFPVVNVVLYTTITLGGYGEALLLGSISLYLSEIIKTKIIDNHKSNFLFALLGLVCGLGLYINPLSLTIIVPSLLNVFFVLIRRKQQVVISTIYLFVFILIGSLPFWYSLFFTNGLAAITEIGGSAVAVESKPFLARSISHLINFILFGATVVFGLRPPWNVEWIGIYLIPFIIIFWLFIFYFAIRTRYRRSSWLKVAPLPAIVGLVLVGFIFTSFGTDPSGRYFLPLIFPLSALFGYSVVRIEKRFVRILAIITVIFQIFGTVISSTKEPYLTSQFYSPSQIDQTKLEELSEFLLSEKQYFGFSNYWISYPLDFVSNEQIIAIPFLPYHPDLRFTERDNRIDKYNQLILDADSYFYITSNNLNLDQLLVDVFNNFEITYKFKIIGDYNIYYDLSEKVTPANLGIRDEFN